MTNLKHWVWAIRPKTMLASIGPVILGLTIAFYQSQQINILIAILTLLCAILLQFSTNIANDYLDHKKGIDTSERLGPIRVTSAGLVSMEQMKKALFCLLLSAFLIGLYLMKWGGPYIMLIGLSSLYFSYGYSGGPYPLSHHGLGEISALLFFGFFAVTGTIYLQTHQIQTLGMFFGISVGFISAAILAINNLRDINTDTQTGKRTLAVRIGERYQRKLILFLVTIPLFNNLVFAFITKHFLLLLPIIPFFLFRNTWKQILIAPLSSTFNDHLATTAKYLFLYSLLSGMCLLIRGPKF